MVFSFLFPLSLGKWIIENNFSNGAFWQRFNRAIEDGRPLCSATAYAAHSFYWMQFETATFGAAVSAYAAMKNCRAAATARAI